MRNPERFDNFSFNGREHNCLFVNVGGRRFLEAGYPLNVDIDLEGRGVAVADLDQDGGLDLVVRSVARKKLTYLHNETGADKSFLRVGLVGRRSNRDGVGAVVRILAGGQRQMRVKMAGNGFQGQSEGTLHFGLGRAERVEELTVRWPSGLEQKFSDLPANRRIEIVEGEERVTVARMPIRPTTARTGGSEPNGRKTWRVWKPTGEPWNPAPGKPTLVALWASWCIPCRAEVPAFNDLYQRLDGSVNLVGVSVEPDTEAARGFIAETQPSYPMALSSSEAMGPLLEVAFSDGVMPLPAAVLLDAQGRVARVFSSGAPVSAMEREALRLAAE